MPIAFFFLKMCLVFETNCNQQECADQQLPGFTASVSSTTSTTISLHLMKGENDSQLQWPIRSELALLITVYESYGIAVPAPLTFAHTMQVESSDYLSNIAGSTALKFAHTFKLTGDNNLDWVYVSSGTKELAKESITTSWQGPWVCKIFLSEPSVICQWCGSSDAFQGHFCIYCGTPQ